MLAPWRATPGIKNNSSENGTIRSSQQSTLIAIRDRYSGEVTKDSALGYQQYPLDPLFKNPLFESPAAYFKGSVLIPWHSPNMFHLGFILPC